MTLEEHLRAKYEYDSETGQFYQRYKTREKRHVTRKPHPNGYLFLRIGQMKIFKREYIRAHRLAWFLYYGEWPNQIDHINGIRNDNRIENLRNVNPTQNAMNRKKYNTSSTGVSNVISNCKGGYMVKFQIKGKIIYFGRNYETIEQAKIIADQKRIELGFHENHGIKPDMGYVQR